MADVIVDCLKDSSQSIDVTIFLYDRFQRLQPMDYAHFFEQLAVRTRHLGPPLKGVTGVRNGVSNPGTAQPSRRAPKLEKRRRLIEKLGDLDRERQELEAQLARYKTTITEEEVTRVERRLNEVHRERVDVLSEVKAPVPEQRASVFVSYAHADEKLRKELGKHLSVLERQGLIATWHDRMVSAGTEWEGTIDARLEQSRIVLLLISSDFIDSKYCYDVEMKRALERHNKREALVIPVILRPVVLKGGPFAKLQALPKDARALIDWPSLDSGCVDVVEGVREAVLALSGAAQQ